MLLKKSIILNIVYSISGQQKFQIVSEGNQLIKDIILVKIRNFSLKIKRFSLVKRNTQGSC